jgi:hypothetical protein
MAGSVAGSERHRSQYPLESMRHGGVYFRRAYGMPMPMPMPATVLSGAGSHVAADHAPCQSGNALLHAAGGRRTRVPAERLNRLERIDASM